MLKKNECCTSIYIHALLRKLRLKLALAKTMQKITKLECMCTKNTKLLGVCVL